MNQFRPLNVACYSDFIPMFRVTSLSIINYR
jgi:hypothetical protein